MDLKIVTGYIPIPRHPRTAAEYGALGENLGTLGVPVHPFYSKIEDCWLHRLLAKYPKATHSVGDNPDKNTMAYQIATHQKFAWLAMAAALDPKPTTFVWLDYGIFHVPGVTQDVVKDFLFRIKDEDFAIPGCWPLADPRAMAAYDKTPNWRFCGGVMVVPRYEILGFFSGVKRAMRAHLGFTNNVTWDVNTMASAERSGRLKARWYQADHNETLFTNY